MRTRSRDATAAYTHAQVIAREREAGTLMRVAAAAIGSSFFSLVRAHLRDMRAIASRVKASDELLLSLSLSHSRSFSVSLFRCVSSNKEFTLVRGFGIFCIVYIQSIERRIEYF